MKVVTFPRTFVRRSLKRRQLRWLPFFLTLTTAVLATVVVASACTFILKWVTHSRDRYSEPQHSRHFNGLNAACIGVARGESETPIQKRRLMLPEPSRSHSSPSSSSNCHTTSPM